MIIAQTLKGFRDFLPQDAIKRQFVINTFKKVFEKYGYDPLETPALEYAEVLQGKYGEDADKLLYLFEDNGGRKVGLRYDQTVPTARVAAQYNDIPKPFKRYQIQPVWRAENTQKGRYREFLQCDADIIGDTYAPTTDAELLTVFLDLYTTLGFTNVFVQYNSRSILRKLINESLGEPVAEERFLSVVRSIDKLDKIGEEGVRADLKEKGVTETQIKAMFAKVTEWSSFTWEQIRDTLDQDLGYAIQMATTNFDVPAPKLVFNPTLARGLDYYTGIIFEAIEPSYKGSLGGGGRYDNLIEQFTGKKLSANGFAVGFDRTLEVATELGLLPEAKTRTQALVCVIDDKDKVFPYALNVTTQLRNSGINTELYLNPTEKLDKQLKYADNKGIPYAVIIGPEEAGKEVVNLKTLATKEQVSLPVADLDSHIK